MNEAWAGPEGHLNLLEVVRLSCEGKRLAASELHLWKMLPQTLPRCARHQDPQEGLFVWSAKLWAPLWIPKAALGVEGAVGLHSRRMPAAVSWRISLQGFFVCETQLPSKGPGSLATHRKSPGTALDGSPRWGEGAAKGGATGSPVESSCLPFREC